MSIINTTLLTRYLIKEVLIASLVVTFLLTFIFLVHEWVHLLGVAASGKFATQIIFKIMIFELPRLISLFLPLGLFLAIIWVYGGMYINNELHVMHASGLSTKKLFIQTSLLAGFVMTMVLLLTTCVNPFVIKEKENLIEQAKTNHNFFETMMPGRFQVSNQGRRVIYIEKLSRNHREAKNLFIADQRRASPTEAISDWIVMSAANGNQIAGPKSKDRFIVAEQGNRYQGLPGQSDFRMLKFEKYKVRIPDIQLISRYQDEEVLPTISLLQNYHLAKNAAEFQWRLAIPFSVLLLAALAIPLSQLKPRQGRYQQLFIAILIYIVYGNLLFIARDWIERKMLPANIGMWYVQGILLLLVIALTLKQANGYGWRRKPS